MFWRMTGLSTASPVETILDKDDYTLEELLDEDEIIQECKSLNSRLINFLRETTQVEQLLRYIVEEPPQDAEKKRTFRFPFIACEIFTCEVDVILRTLVENEELMNLLFSFTMPDHSHSTLLAGYFSKVVVCLMLRKTVSFMNFVQAHKEIIHQLVDLLGITSIMEVLIRLIGADEHMYSNYMEAIPWLDDMNILEMIVDKFSSSDSPEVHANAAEILCAITRYAPPGLASKISSPSFVGRLFRHALEKSRPKYVLVHSLTVCISLLDSKRLVSASYNAYRSPPSHGSITVNPETVESLLESLGDLLKLLETPRSPYDSTLSTTYGSLRPPLGKHRLKIVEFISVLSNVGSETAGKELIRLGVLRRILDLFLEYPFNNFLHHHVENILISCLESNQSLVTEHLLEDCDLVGKILAAENNVTLLPDGPTVPAEGKSLPRIGSIGHITRIANKLVQLGNSNSVIQKHLQGKSEWIDWHANVLLKRNATESVYQWVCGRPAALQDRTRDSDDEDLRDRDYDIAMPDVYFGGESAEVVISSLCLGEEEEDSSSLITNSNWFAFEGNRFANEQLTNSFAPSPSTDEADEVILGEGEELDGTTARSQATDSGHSEEPESAVLVNDLIEESKEQTIFLSTISEFEKPPEWVEWRETSDRADVSVPQPGAVIPNGDIRGDVDLNKEQAIKIPTNPFCSDPENMNNNEGKLNEEAGCSPDLPAASLVNNPKPVENKDLGMHFEQGSSTADAEIKANQEAKEVAQVEKEATENN